ncbi:hypothetical protein ACTFIY_007589 [Dictyostelium cf. discoideum]
MFALVVPPYPVNVAVQTISPTKYCFQFENRVQAKEFTLFLTDIQNFTSGYNAAIYLAYQPFTDWKYLGFINSNKPSIICKMPSETLDNNNNNNNNNNINNGFINNINSIIPTEVIQIGISIETDLEIQSKPLIEQQQQQQQQNTSSSTSINNFIKTEEFKQVAFKLCDNLVNYILSFSTSNNTVPSSSINKWYENFQKKLKNDQLDFLK